MLIQYSTKFGDIELHMSKKLEDNEEPKLSLFEDGEIKWCFLKEGELESVKPREEIIKLRRWKQNIEGEDVWVKNPLKELVNLGKYKFGLYISFGDFEQYSIRTINFRGCRISLFQQKFHDTPYTSDDEERKMIRLYLDEPGKVCVLHSSSLDPRYVRFMEYDRHKENIVICTEARQADWLRVMILSK